MLLKSLKWRRVIQKSGLFDARYYLFTYSDVRISGIDPVKHYVEYGVAEGRNPSAEFDTSFYLTRYGDVRESGVNPLVQYILFGKGEGRLKNNDELNMHIIDESGLFDTRYYLFAYSDVRISGIDPVKHYVKYGVAEGRNPSADFDTNFYLKHYGDVRESGVNPLVQYILYGQEEGRLRNNDELFINIIEESGLFDRGYYLSTYPEVKENAIEPVLHYIRYGVKEGKNPSAEFNSSYYLEQCNDESVTEINPIVHYVLYGKAKGLKILDEQKLVIEKEFNAEYYLSHYPDVKNSSLTALDHFYVIGWKENRSPNEFFDTDFYMKSNPDVKQSGVNPFYHYLSSGRKEGRMAVHPAGYKRKILENATSPIDMVKKHACKLPVVNKIESLRSHIMSISKKPVVVSVSHDRYIDHIGGVQMCIFEEQAALNVMGYSHLNISPACPLPVLSENDNWRGDIIIDNEFFGTYKSEDILAVFGGTVFKKELYFVMHAIHGHSEKFLKKLFDCVDFKKNFFWIHDYFTVCQNYNLLRNNLNYCSGPDVNSQACQICTTGGKNRLNHIASINTIFEYIPFHVIAPSQTALSIWLEKTKLPYIDTTVHEHRNIISENDRAPIDINGDEPLRIAFLGHAAVHKGWYIFKELVERFNCDERYEFYHLGTNDHDDGCPAKFYTVRNNRDNMTCMRDTIRKYNIHVSFLWSIWPETYNLVTYEALGAGSVVLTNKNSGNIAAEIINMKQGLVLEFEEDLFRLFQSGDIRTKIKRIYEENIIHGELESSNLTTRYISCGESS